MLGIANMCHHPKFHQNWSNIWTDIMKVWIFHYFSLKTVICTFFRCFGLKNRRTLKLSAFSSLYECIDLELELQWLLCIVAANFIKIREQIAEISHLTIFLNGSVHHLEFFFNLTFWTTVMLRIANMCHHAEFHQNWSNVCTDIVKVWIFHYFGTKTVICTFSLFLGKE